MDNQEVVYDATEVQLRALDAFASETMKLDDLVNPTAVQLLIQERVVNLTDLKASKTDLARLRQENARLQQDREELRIKMARTTERGTLAWIEIPISFLGGYSINILSTDPKSGIGWILLLLTLVILVFIRISDISALLKEFGKKGE